MARLTRRQHRGNYPILEDRRRSVPEPLESLVQSGSRNGSPTDLGGGWNSTSSLFWFSDNAQLYAIANAALYKVNTSTGAKTALGNDFWFGWTAMSSRVIGR
jgi:hypothetical protein